MFVIKYTKSPRGYYVGYIKGDGRLHFFAATTESKLFERGVKSAYDNFRASSTQVCMDARPVSPDEFPSHLIDHKWYCVWWSGMRKDGRPAATMASDKRYSPVRKKTIVTSETKTDNEPKDKFEFHFTKIKNGKICVYGCKKVAEYDAEQRPAIETVEPFVPTDIVMNKD